MMRVAYGTAKVFVSVTISSPVHGTRGSRDCVFSRNDTAGVRYNDGFHFGVGFDFYLRPCPVTWRRAGGRARLWDAIFFFPSVSLRLGLSASPFIRHTCRPFATRHTCPFITRRHTCRPINNSGEGVQLISEWNVHCTSKDEGTSTPIRDKVWHTPELRIASAPTRTLSNPINQSNLIYQRRDGSPHWSLALCASTMLENSIGGKLYCVEWRTKP